MDLGMARSDYESSTTPSLLDRLFDDELEVKREPVTTRLQTVRMLERSVSRDIESLLNSRQPALEAVPSEFDEANRSLLIYGLPDFTSFSLVKQDDRNRIRAAVEQAINVFEPRLERVHVSLEATRGNDRGLRFRIDALLRVDPAPEPVTFDAFLQLTTQQYVVRGQD